MLCSTQSLPPERRQQSFRVGSKFTVNDTAAPAEPTVVRLQHEKVFSNVHWSPAFCPPVNVIVVAWFFVTDIGEMAV